MPTWFIVAAIVVLVVGFLLKVVGPPVVADWFTEWRRKRGKRNEDERRFADVQGRMPELIQNIREHLARCPDARNLVVLHNEQHIFSDGTEGLSKSFPCYRNRHGNVVDDKLAALVDASYLGKAHRADPTAHRMTVEFVAFVKRSG